MVGNKRRFGGSITVLKKLFVVCLPFILLSIGKLPLAVAQLFGYGVGTIWYCLPVRSRAVAKANIKHCFPSFNKLKVEYFLLKNLQQTACTALECPAFWLWPVECLSGLMKEVHGEYLLQAAFSQEKPILFAVPHMGAWEAMQAYFPGRHIGSVLYRPPRLEALDGFIRACRSRHGCGHLIPITPSGIREIFKHLKQKEIVSIMPDQVPKSDGILAPFFNQPARTMTLLPKLAQKTDATVLLVCIRRLGIGRGFAIHFLPSSEEIKNPDLTIATQALNAGVEMCVQLAPEQYQWIYKRFKRV